ncbi:hypothetical protein AV530_008621 [Patagioenas fasciata monilis]|uniref:Uncharacterized protein n=1 Tax=Patagioenas fasciata monilis TaxID=372326 RepID=A0A1V4L2K4_PATFA|nr:hypothetical protein AV530_008621 [Patagioenas fasciata monilis]
MVLDQGNFVIVLHIKHGDHEDTITKTWILRYALKCAAGGTEEKTVRIRGSTRGVKAVVTNLRNKYHNTPAIVERLLLNSQVPLQLIPNKNIHLPKGLRLSRDVTTNGAHRKMWFRGQCTTLQVTDMSAKGIDIPEVQILAVMSTQSPLNWGPIENL